MAYQQNDNSGSLFKNETKQAPNHPDYEGNAVINGQTKRIAAWIKTAKSGKKYLSLAFSDPRPAQQPTGYAPQGGYAPQNNPRGMQQTGQFPPAPVNDDMPDDIGF